MSLSNVFGKREYLLPKIIANVPLLLPYQLEYASMIGEINPNLYTDEATEELIEYPDHNIGQTFEK